MAEGGNPGEPEIDVRFTFANERTFLAWNRTALGLIAAGAAAAAFLKDDLSGGRLVIGLPLIMLGAVLGVYSFRQWEANERAMRLGEPLPTSRMPRVLAVTIAVVAVLTAVLVIIDQVVE